jgi:hypothetical protein
MDLARGLYYCFVCQSSGDLVSFVMQLDGVDFQEAAKRLGALEPIDDAEARRFRQERAERERREQAKRNAWVDHLEQMAVSMETDERVRDWAFENRHDELHDLAQKSITLTVAEYFVSKSGGYGWTLMGHNCLATWKRITGSMSGYRMKPIRF